MMESEKKLISVDDYLNSVDYSFKGYMPSSEALLFVNFIKEVNGGKEENETPLVHLVMMDRVFNKDRRCAVMCHRGLGKTTIFSEYLILFIAAFGRFPGFGSVNLMMYVSDSIENGVKNLRRNVEFRYQESEFLQGLIPNRKIGVGTEGAGYVDMDRFEEQVAGGRKFTDIRLEFMNNKGHRLVVKGYGSLTGVRGAKELGQRPSVAILDDIVSDEDAKSDTIISSIENTVYKAVSKALHPTRQKMVWLGTPFNAKDPLYKAVESGAWKSSVFPICEKFPVSKEEFRGAWEDRFPYEYVKMEYDEAMQLHRPENFNQELMLRIMGDEDRLVADDDLVWYSREIVYKNRELYNYYITTDFATSAKKSADYSVISVWAYSSNSDWLLVDGICKQQLMDLNIKDLFRLVSMYKPLQVGVEVTGQQGGFIQWIQQEMMSKNIFFNLKEVRPSTDKMTRFNMFLPIIKAKKLWLAKEMRESDWGREFIDEVSKASRGAFKSKHDDCLDTISQLSDLDSYAPSSNTDLLKEKKDKDDDSLWYNPFEKEESYQASRNTIF
jgi:predicted phage terminase large subunit-like protein